MKAKKKAPTLEQEIAELVADAEAMRERDEELLTLYAEKRRPLEVMYKTKPAEYVKVATAFVPRELILSDPTTAGGYAGGKTLDWLPRFGREL